MAATVPQTRETTLSQLVFAIADGDVVTAGSLAQQAATERVQFAAFSDPETKLHISTIACELDREAATTAFKSSMQAQLIGLGYAPIRAVQALRSGVQSLHAAVEWLGDPPGTVSHTQPASASKCSTFNTADVECADATMDNGKKLVPSELDTRVSVIDAENIYLQPTAVTAAQVTTVSDVANLSRGQFAAQYIASKPMATPKVITSYNATTAPLGQFSTPSATTPVVLASSNSGVMTNRFRDPQILPAERATIAGSSPVALQCVPFSTLSTYTSPALPGTTNTARLAVSSVLHGGTHTPSSAKGTRLAGGGRQAVTVRTSTTLRSAETPPTGLANGGPAFVPVPVAASTSHWSGCAVPSLAASTFIGGVGGGVSGAPGGGYSHLRPVQQVNRIPMCPPRPP